MLTHLMFALATASAPAAGAEAIDAFAAVCTPASDFAQLRQRAATERWQPYEPTPADDVGRLVALGRAALATGKGAIDVLRRAEGQEGLTLMLVLVDADDLTVNACRLYGGAGAAAPQEADLSRRLGRPPTRRVAEHGLTTTAWEPGWASGDDSLELLTVAPGSAAAKALAFTGWALVARSIHEADSGDK